MNDRIPETGEKFHPYIPASETRTEFSCVAVLTGMILAVVFGAANAYLGLRVGMTFSASIPAAVISMVVLRVILRRRSILENNLVQTIASAGESVAAGVIFTMPVFFLWADEGHAEPQSFTTLTLLALFGGVLGVLFMIPLRRYLTVQEHKTLLFPEGRACAQVLLAGEKDGQGGARFIFLGGAIAIVVKLLIDGFRVCVSKLVLPLTKLHTEISCEPYPSLAAVGYICGLRTSATLFAGGLLSWLVLIPLVVYFGGEGDASGGAVREVYQAGGASAIWSTYIRYIGAGAVAAGGIISLVKAVPVMLSSFGHAIRGIGTAGKGTERTDRDLDPRFLVAGIAAIFVLLIVLSAIPLNAFGVVLFMICGFFFAVVASRIVGVIGSSNSPCSGMTIAALIVSAFVLKKAGITGAQGMIASLAVAAMCCIISCIAGDTSQDLKTGYLLGATPWKMQLGEMLGVVVTSGCLGGVLLLLHRAWGFGSVQIPAPQAHLMKLVVEGVMCDTMSWTLVFVGVFIALTMECLGVSSLCVAIGVFLPIASTSFIFLGGIVRHFVAAMKKSDED
ncbi:MAG: oligopeptide transporter, OPT family, partial [Victivallaceae bacterium]|nr:oligopeptide transporter, OPT family [Victivallaceae bacterium]